YGREHVRLYPLAAVDRLLTVHKRRLLRARVPRDGPLIPVRVVAVVDADRLVRLTRELDVELERRGRERPFINTGEVEPEPDLPRVRGPSRVPPHEARVILRLRRVGVRACPHARVVGRREARRARLLHGHDDEHGTERRVRVLARAPLDDVLTAPLRRAG